MSGVSPVNSNTTIGLTHTDGLTPDGLVLYLQSQLGDIDAKIESFMAKQKLIQAQRKELNAMATVLAKMDVPEKDEKTTFVDPAEDADVFNDAEVALKELGYDPKILAKIENYDLSSVSKEELESVKLEIENAIKDLESSASLDMIQLQSCVSQRNTCISLATNLMSAIGKGEESITGNIGR